MKTLYLDAFSGISGDMFLGTMLDLGLDFNKLESELRKLKIDGYKLSCKQNDKSSIYGTNFDVQVNGGKDKGFIEHKHNHSHHNARHLNDILKLIDNSSLKESVKNNSKNIFTEIAKAESTVHHMSLTDVHFHEVGAVDSIIDIVGCCIALDLMDIDNIISSPLSDGSGFIQVAHGQMPVPVPAVAQMRVGTDIPIKQRLDIKTELVTPTGMGIVKTLVNEFGPLPEQIKPLKIGYGFGKRDTGGFNALRGILFEKKKLSQKVIKDTKDKITLIEANLDDQTGEGLGYVMQKLMNAGAYDVFFTPIQMKKDRPATKITVLGNISDQLLLIKIILKETSTIGVRYQHWHRVVMQRRFEKVTTDYGEIKIKIATYGNVEKKIPEYIDCAQIAHRKNISFINVYQSAIIAAQHLN
ncbi:nickel pincer cofactor biosynthesis protein LarC [Apilactobacillus micheneri]|uniref:Pyridinium-3,5-bisthiocarboxylic acid mononucleotide nickel insertion protein n=1 Tax=Apilactobacillus micheneri TaxID=1899430 RepID=A0ABY2YYG6_9LACO|nr:nickel pincer cofactor biosynthesis protein LarC [Apilactobacillus micheneri]TPR26364.1 nickel pincer cofactor biosynthesis protein LarC [Apilactobacillus micheneri]TPR27118.1 nickel pincer cofactor biosynthesis protein LarC [Apilactobacillus micheneri]TPR27366.1 nickel pincer cofactor biosynthesis protein LarC [Apilactobacillus micheneri]TPR31881.1 nickel pincer cofactor biosynthesis protein LarC [Apilactobacillus micheneri]TPR32285.1 nickel pincer cofactor biosynthesis protein LarC [Apila